MRNITLPLFLFLFGQCVFSLDTFKIVFFIIGLNNLIVVSFVIVFFIFCHWHLLNFLKLGAHCLKNFLADMFTNILCASSPQFSPLRTLVTHTFDHLSLPNSAQFLVVVVFPVLFLSVSF